MVQVSEGDTMDVECQIAGAVHDAESEICEDCLNKIDKWGINIRSDTRKQHLSMAISFLLCIVSLVACGCTAALYLKIQTQDFRKELVASLKEEFRASHLDKNIAFTEYLVGADQEVNHDEDDFKDLHAVKKMLANPRDRRGGASSGTQAQDIKNSGGKKRGKNGRRGKKRNKCCKKETIKKAVADEVAKLKNDMREIQGCTNETIKQVVTDEVGKLNKDIEELQVELRSETQRRQNWLSIAHYTSFIDEEYIEKILGKLDDGNLHNAGERSPPKTLEKEVPSLNGILNRGSSLRIKDAPGALNVFTEASWMKNMSGEQLFDLNRANGTFRARITGLYHVYAHVPFYLEDRLGDSKGQGQIKHISVELLHENRGVIRSIDDCNFSYNTTSFAKNATRSRTAKDFRYLPCHLGAVIKIDQNDTLTLENKYPDNVIVTSNDKLYFGANLFAKL
ncbi:uncharacterized protein LOC128220226 isoform X2 [Mya arenaria]|uniref:uncharacterized protein LOC128220226 isoform X2 n=1 Tax=Mya arenaria TaxID=6604 RepID=UPI0022DF8FA2|nr:uncharacterized protein LOC128220226 isoform X2 [Mya arenaria]